MAASSRGESSIDKEALKKEVAQIEERFALDTDQAQKIVSAIQQDLQKGLTSSPGSIPMHPTWALGVPSGQEQGNFIGVDLGRTIKGTNLRVCEVEFQGNGDFDIAQSSYRVPETVKIGDSDGLWDFVATCISMFLDTSETHAAKDIAFTFSFPVEQATIDQAILQKWLRGFEVKGVIGQDVVPLFQKALDAKGLDLRVVAVINDCVGTLEASAYCEKNVRIGGIFGTGSSIAYYQKCEAIKKIDEKEVGNESLMAINCEWGEFKNDALPSNQYDKELEKIDNDKGQHTFEKLFAGYYLPELFRLVVKDMHTRGFIFAGKDLGRLKSPFAVDIVCLRTIESDPFDNLFDTQDLFVTKYGLTPSLPELLALKRIAKAISTRSANMVACGLAAVYHMMHDHDPMAIGCDGSLFVLYPEWGKRMGKKLNELVGKQIQLNLAEDGNGVGAALVAGMTVHRVKRGDKAGVKNLP